MASLTTVIKWKMPEFHTPKRKKEGGIDYQHYPLTMQQEFSCIVEGLVIIAGLAWFFYRSIYAFVFLLPLFSFYCQEKRREIRNRQIQQLEKEFRELLLCVSVNMQAGYSIENAFLESDENMVNLFGSSSFIVRELEIIRRGMSNQIPMEHLLADLGRRCPGGEIEEFSALFQVAQKTGGKWMELMKRTIVMIQEKAEVQEEIETLIHAKRMESRMMCVIPFLILFYIDLTSSGYFDPLYHNLAGICIMTGCLALYCFAVYWMEKIMRIPS